MKKAFALALVAAGISVIAVGCTVNLDCKVYMGEPQHCQMMPHHPMGCHHMMRPNGPAFAPKAPGMKIGKRKHFGKPAAPAVKPAAPAAKPAAPVKK